MESRTCKVCGIKQEIKDFEDYITNGGKRKRRFQCKSCRVKKILERQHKKKSKQCPICLKQKQPFEFVRTNSLDFNEYGKICRECAYQKNKEVRNTKSKKKRKIRTKLKKNNEYVKRYRKTKEKLIDLFGDKCAICGNRFSWYAYDFHHKNSKEKESKISRYTRLTWNHISNLPEFNEEIKKCILVCAICHRKIHLKSEGGN